MKELKPSKNIWLPPFYAEMHENAQDGDYLRMQQCCPSCGAYTGDLPGYYYIENDECPNCRQASKQEKWSDELKRIAKRENLCKDEIAHLMEWLSHFERI